MEDNIQSPGQTPGVSDIDLSTTEGQPTTKSPLQDRFDELSRTIREQRSTMETMGQTINQMMAIQAQSLANRPAQDPTAPPPPMQIAIPEGMDPAQAKFFQDLTRGFQQTIEATNKRTEQLVQQAVGGVRMSQEQMEFQQAVQGQPKEVADLAGKLLQDWRSRGATGWSPRDAVVYARGMLPNAQAPGRRAPNGQFTPGDQGITPGGGLPPPPVQQQLPAPLPDAQLAKLPIAQQEKYWADRLAKSGGVDQPIEY